MRFFYFALFTLLLCLALGEQELHKRFKPTFFKEEGIVPLINKNDPFLGVDYRSGYVPIGPKGNDMFYWFFPNAMKQQTPDTPFILWLSGGPACSSMTAELLENGPILVKEDGKVVLNQFSWSKLGDIVYVDQPVGTGFSDIVYEEGTLGTERGIDTNLHEFLTKFIEKYPFLKNRPFYITGESYAGHYIPSLAAYLLKNPIPGLSLKGVAIGNGWVDPKTQYPAYLDFALQNNMLNRTQYKVAQHMLPACMHLVNISRGFTNAFCTLRYVQPMLGSKNLYDIRKECKKSSKGSNLCYDMSGVEAFANSEVVQKALGVKKHWKPCNTTLYFDFLLDWVATEKDDVAEILDAKIDVLAYSGDKDFICNWIGGDRWTQAVEWSKKKEFNNQRFVPWSVDGVPAGELRRVDNFSFLRVYNAGHMTPMDQPEVSFEMLRQFFKTGLKV